MPIRWLDPVTALVKSSISPDIVVRERVVLALLALLEPGMLITCVIDDQVQDQFHVSLVHFGNELVHVRHGAVFRPDIFVITDIVAHVVLRTVVHWRKPDVIRPYRLDMVEMIDDAA